MADRISVSMAIDALAEQVSVVFDTEEKLCRERAIRNNLIRDAREGGIGYKRLTQTTGLSRDRLYTIVNDPRSTVRDQENL